jgi:hypothetical protein
MNNKSVELVELVYEEPNNIHDLAEKIGEV